MYHLPSRRSKKYQFKRPNLIPILDAVFIFIFFLLMSADFIKIFEIQSNVPIVSNSPPPKNKKRPLALTLRIYKDYIGIYTGVPSVRSAKITKVSKNSYDLNKLHSYLLKLKSKHINERTIIFEPIFDLKYDELVKIMDSVRLIRNTDNSIYKKDKDGNDQKIRVLFDDIVYGNIRS